MTAAARLGELLEALGPRLRRFSLDGGEVVAELDVAGRRLRLCRAVPEGEHDVVGLAVELLDQVDALAGELMAIVRGERTSRPACTGVAARWCPVHGDCSCPAAPEGGPTFRDPACTLHGPTSDHAEDL